MKKLSSLLAVFLSVASLQAYDIRTGLLSYYPFDQSLTEDAAFTNDFTVVGSPVLVTTNSAPRDSVLGLPGPSFSNPSYLRIDHPTDNTENGLPIYRNGSYSVTMWVKGAPQSNRYLFSHGSSASANPLFILQTGTSAANNNRFDLILRTDGGTALVNHSVSSNVVFDNTWHHVAFVDNRGRVSVYVDGNLDGNSSLFSYSPAGTFTFDRTSIGSLVRAAASTNNIFNGSIDEVSLWERPLEADEVRSIMTNGIPLPVPPLPAAIITQPAPQVKDFQETAVFSVIAAGTRPNHILTYQWRSNGVPIVDATNRTLRVPNLTTNESGVLYTVAVSNAIGGEISAPASLTVIPEPAPNVPSGVVSYWPFDSVTNDNGVYRTDDLYSGYDLTLLNMTEANLVPGQFTNALAFDNLQNTFAVRTEGLTAYNTNTGYTVSMWVKGDGSFQSDARVFAEGATNANGSVLGNPLFTIGTAAPANPLGLARVYVRSDTGAILLDRTSQRTVFDNTWRHLVWVDQAGEGKLYVDGVLDETDFTYAPTNRTPVSLNTTSVGGIARGTNFLAGFFGDVDEVATWNRPLTFTEIQQVRTESVPAPLAAIAPFIATQPVSQSVFTQADVTFSVAAGGTAPLTNQWFKGATALANETNLTLTITNVELSDAGTYSIRISNAGGTTNSEPATLQVSTRPAPPQSLSLDFDNRGAVSSDLESGFESFSLSGSGATGAATARLFGGVEVIVSGSNGTSADSRNRLRPTALEDFTEVKLLQDFIFSPPTTGAEGLDVTIKYLAPNKTYTGTIWSFDTDNPGARVSDWFANGMLVKDDYTFDGNFEPTNNTQYQFSFQVTSDADGTVVIQGRREESGVGVSVFLNALRLALPVSRISNISLVDGKIRLVVETPDSSVQHSVVKTDNLTSISFTPVQGVTSTVLSPTSIQLEFDQPANDMQFYRVGRAD